MDLVTSCKDKLGCLRVKELKDVLAQLGLAKQGKKQVLVDRILSSISGGQVSNVKLGKDEIAKLVDDIYRKMRTRGSMDLASNAQSSSEKNNRKVVEEPEQSLKLDKLDVKVRCPCGSSLFTESMLQCDDPRCQVWQHINCVIIPEKPMEGAPNPPVPLQFYCEICRLNRADPFWVTVAHPLLPVKSTTMVHATDGTNPVQTVEKVFQLTRADRDLLQKADYDVQAWCILLNDKVSLRLQWPLFTDLQVNDVQVRTTNRPGSQLLGHNGRDDGSAITTCTKEGTNKIFLSGCDARIFCLGVRIGRRRTVQQVLNMIPKESDGECFEDALGRVCRCIGGGNGGETADSDSDLEVVADSVTVNLRCPMSGSRMRIAGRFKPCAHMGCFDLETFVELNQRARKWQCPICLKNYCLENIIIDPYFNRIVTMMRGCGEDVTEIDVKPDGSWRAKNGNLHRDLTQWHFPDGSLSLVGSEFKTKQVIRGGSSEGNCGLKLGIRKNCNGEWEVKAENICSLSSENNLPGQFENQFVGVMPMSTSATGSCRDGEDPSVNQDGTGQFDFSTNNGNELDSFPLNYDISGGVTNGLSSVPLTNAEVIVLSDSEEDTGDLVSPQTVYESGKTDVTGVSFSLPPDGLQLHASFLDDQGLGSGNSVGHGVPLWPLPSGTHEGSGLQLFGTGTVDSSSLVDAPHNSVACSLLMNGFPLAIDTTIGCATQVPDTIYHSDADMNDGLVDNPLAFDRDDPSLQMFLSSRPGAAPVQSNLREQQDVANGLRSEDWISLRLGGGGCENGESAITNASNALTLRPEVELEEADFRLEEDRMESSANNDSLLLKLNDNKSEKEMVKRQSSDSSPSQLRTVRPRLYFSVDSDSD
ncbi:hypothetical protein IFM89_000525 [Coptis chinensis]|uniref:E3 SUMO-protein ligase SIZ1 n=1 Tax=Coptis chinensis TaxID=261450 RepID=A0A835LDV8_9MAGN|nr:hypothetical protein IFM89_000525 [Coptis chinensis]